MKELKYLESELLLMLDNIERVKKFKTEQKDSKWKAHSSNVVGELKHRAVALKQRLTIIKKLTTSDFN